MSEKLDSAEQLDFNLAWQVARTLRLEVAVDNLLDEDYENAVGFPGSGRAARIGVRFTNR